MAQEGGERGGEGGEGGGGKRQKSKEKRRESPSPTPRPTDPVPRGLLTLALASLSRVTGHSASVVHLRSVGLVSMGLFCHTHASLFSLFDTDASRLAQGTLTISPSQSHPLNLTLSCHISCELSLHRGLAYAKWGQDCSMEGGGWQASGKDSCGADSYPWVPFALPNVHWDAVQRALEGPS